MLHRKLFPAPLHEGLVYIWHPPSTRTGCNQYYAAGVLARAQHCSHAAAVASHSVHSTKTTSSI